MPRKGKKHKFPSIDTSIRINTVTREVTIQPTQHNTLHMRSRKMSSSTIRTTNTIKTFYSTVENPLAYHTHQKAAQSLEDCLIGAFQSYHLQPNDNNQKDLDDDLTIQDIKMEKIRLLGSLTDKALLIELQPEIIVSYYSLENIKKTNSIDETFYTINYYDNEEVKLSKEKCLDFVYIKEVEYAQMILDNKEHIVKRGELFMKISRVNITNPYIQIHNYLGDFLTARIDEIDISPYLESIISINPINKSKVNNNNNAKKLQKVHFMSMNFNEDNQNKNQIIDTLDQIDEVVNVDNNIKDKNNNDNTAQHDKTCDNSNNKSKLKKNGHKTKIKRYSFYIRRAIYKIIE